MSVSQEGRLFLHDNSTVMSIFWGHQPGIRALPISHNFDVNRVFNLPLDLSIQTV